MAFVIFISYARDDFENGSKELKDYLEKYGGFEVFLDQDMQKGSKWKDEIEKSIKKCDVFIVILTTAAIQSNQIKEEVDLAKEFKKPIIPCKDKILGIGWEDIPWDLSSFDGIEFRDSDNLNRFLIKEITNLQKEPARPNSTQSSNIRTKNDPALSQKKYLNPVGKWRFQVFDQYGSSGEVQFVDDGNFYAQILEKTTNQNYSIDGFWKVEQQDQILLLLKANINGVQPWNYLISVENYSERSFSGINMDGKRISFQKI